MRMRYCDALAQMNTATMRVEDPILGDITDAKVEKDPGLKPTTGCPAIDFESNAKAQIGCKLVANRAHTIKTTLRTFFDSS